MGVKGLWKLLDGTGRPIDLDSLEGKVLAVDISVWLNMAVKGMRDYHGHASQTAHLVSLFNRICKLLYHGIKPVFVFDGKAPALKHKTLRERRERKTVHVSESKSANEKLLQNFLKRQLLDEISGSAPKRRNERSKAKTIPDETTQKPANTKQKPQEDDIYNLPPLSTNFDQSDDSELEEELTMRAELQREFYDNVTHNEFQNILDMNIESKDFNSLPSDVQYELLQDLHEVRKRQRTRIETMPEESNSFSNYQIKGILAKRKITKKMESVESKMSQENVAASSNFLGVNRESMEDHKVVARQLVSDSKSHFIWLRKSSNMKSKGQSEDQLDEKNHDEIATSSSSQETRIVLPENLGVPITSNKQSSLKGTTKIEFNHQTKNLIDVENPTNRTDSERLRETIEETLNTNLMDDGRIHDEVIATVARSNDGSNSSVSITAGIQSHAPVKKTNDRGDVHINEIWESTSLGSVTFNQKDLGIPPDCISQNPAQSHFCSSTLEKLPQLPEIPLSQNQAPSLMQKGLFNNTYSGNHIDTKETLDLPTLQSPLISGHGVSDEEKSTASGDDFVDVPEKADRGEAPTANQYDSLDSTEKVSSGVESQEDVQLQDENLWEGLDVADVEQYTEEIDHQSKELRKLMQAKQRAAREVSQSAQSECQDLLKLFGLPYIVSPQEAEAQCAALEEIGLTNGTITDDSDIWLFGGKYVIKDMFGSRKDPVAYHVSDIETQLGLNRDRFICIALCSGSDYTRGIHGVGPVTAMEILKEFDGAGIDGLVKLKQWWDDTVTSPKQILPTETKIKSQIRRINLRKDFPSEAVYNAYMRPIVDTNNKKFEWGFPDLDELRMFATDVMGWTRQKVDEMLLPVIKRQGQRRSAQSKITNYYHTSLHPIEKKRSKRVQRAALVLTGKQDIKKSSRRRRQHEKKVNLIKDHHQSSELKLSESSSSEGE